MTYRVNWQYCIISQLRQKLRSSRKKFSHELHPRGLFGILITSLTFVFGITVEYGTLAAREHLRSRFRPFPKGLSLGSIYCGTALNCYWSVGRGCGGAGIAAGTAGVRHCCEMIFRTDRYSGGTAQALQERSLLPSAPAFGWTRPTAQQLQEECCQGAARFGNQLPKYSQHQLPRLLVFPPFSITLTSAPPTTIT